MRSRLGSLVAAMLVAAPPLFSQTPVAVLAPQTRVRVDVPTLGIRRGIMLVAAQHGDTLLLVPRGGLAAETISVHLPVLTRLDVSRGRWPSINQGSKVGAAAGAVVIGAIAYGASDDPARCTLFFCNFDSRGRRVSEGAVIGAAVGGVLGALVGIVFPGERWQRILPLRAP